MTTILTIANQKGGVGKTTTAVTLAHGLAMQGLRILLVDLDSQGHVAESLGVEKAPGLQRLLVLEEPLSRVVVTARKNLDIVPSNKTTDAAKRYLVTEPLSHKALSKVLKNADYDLVLLDCAPSFDLLHIAALVASDMLLIPTKPEYLAVEGVRELLRSAHELLQEGESHVNLVAVLPTFYERVTRETAEQLRTLVGAFGQRVWPPIPQDTRAREAAAHGQSLWEYASWSPVIVGTELSDGRRVGGYQTTLDRLLQLLREAV